jgi:prepilin peptidase CpaA
MGIARLTELACVIVFTAIGLATDLKVRKLPNALTVPAFFAGLLFRTVEGLWFGGVPGGGSEWWFALGGFITGFGIMLVLWLLGGGGGGDVKFMGALGVWLGAWRTFQVLILSAVLSGTLTLVLTGQRVFKLKRLRMRESDASAKRPRKKKGSGWSWRSRENWIVPYGVPVALATWALVALELGGYRLRWPPM